ncbi:hypothetical protein [Streptomyces chartreusis]|uniref:hypothetical protein n=1 Tax=Streptomyces chartreusis TaxID=1969 RepID=UPI002E16DE93
MVIRTGALRHDQRMADMAGGSDIYTTTVRRWRGEPIALPRRPCVLDRILKHTASRAEEFALITAL